MKITRYIDFAFYGLSIMYVYIYIKQYTIYKEQTCENLNSLDENKTRMRLKSWVYSPEQFISHMKNNFDNDRSGHMVVTRFNLLTKPSLIFTTLICKIMKN